MQPRKNLALNMKLRGEMAWESTEDYGGLYFSDGYKAWNPGLMNCSWKGREPRDSLKASFHAHHPLISQSFVNITALREVVTSKGYSDGTRTENIVVGTKGGN